jgi:hypothetical protein
LASSWDRRVAAVHYFVLVVIPADGDVDDLVSEALAPFDEDLEVVEVVDEEYGEHYWHNPLGMWDRYQIGGRWTGQLSGYDPRSDPALAELWPTEFPRHHGDVQDATVVLNLSDDQSPYAIFVHGSETPLIESERWEGHEHVLLRTPAQVWHELLRIVKTRAQAGLKDRVVVVDLHN